MKLVAVLGAAGGSGATTVTALLGTALVQMRRPALALDACPENVLRLHLNMEYGDNAGWATSLLAGNDWHAFAYRAANGLDFLPFGALAQDRELAKLSSFFEYQPPWLRQQLGALQLEPDTVVVCDTPRYPPALRQQVLDAADLLLLVTRPDAIAYATATRLAQQAADIRGLTTMMLVNGFDPARRLDRDIAVLLKGAFRQRLAPVMLHRDETAGEALACKQTALDYAPSSQLAHEASALATWMLARLGQHD